MPVIFDDEVAPKGIIFDDEGGEDPRYQAEAEADEERPVLHAPTFRQRVELAAQPGVEASRWVSKLLEETARAPVRLPEAKLLPGGEVEMEAPSLIPKPGGFGATLPLPAFVAKDWTKFLTRFPGMKIVDKVLPDEVKVGLYNAGADFANFMLSPQGVATVGAGALPKTAQAGISAYFAGTMMAHMPEAARAAGDALGRGDVATATRLIAGGIGQLVLSGVLSGATVAKVREAVRKGEPMPPISPVSPPLAPKTEAVAELTPEEKVLAETKLPALTEADVPEPSLTLTDAVAEQPVIKGQRLQVEQPKEISTETLPAAPEQGVKETGVKPGVVPSEKVEPQGAVFVGDRRFTVDELKAAKSEAPAGGAGRLAEPSSVERKSIYTAEERAAAEAKAGEPVAEPFVLSERVHKLLEELGVPSAERYLPKRFLGIFKKRSQNVRVKALSDVFTAAHEAAHWVSDAFGIGKKLIADTGRGAMLRRQLTDIYTEFYPGAKRSHKLSKRIEEGIAVLMEQYAYAPSKVAAKYPALVDAFIKPSGKYYHPKFTQLLDGIGKIVGEHMKLSPEEQIGARIVRGEEVVRRENGFNFAQRFVFEAFNAAEPLVRWARKGGVSETIADPTVWYYSWLDRASIVANWITGTHTTRFSPEGKIIREPGSIRNYARLVQGKEKEFDAYLVARRVVEDHNRLADMQAELIELRERVAEVEAEPEEIEPERIAEMKEELVALEKSSARLQSVLKRDNLNLSASTAVVDKFAAQFAPAVKIYDALNERLVKLARDHGLISDKAAEEWLSRKGYASFLRHITDELLGDGESNPYSSSSQSKAKVFKERTGSELSIVSPVSNQKTAIFEVVSKAAQNDVWQKVLDLGDRNPEIARRFEVIETQRVPREDGGFSYPQDADPNLIRVWKNGQRVFVKPAPEFRALMEFMKPQDLGIVADLLTVPSGVFTRLTTSANPIFAVGNLTVDQLTGLMQTKTGFKPVIDPVKGLAQFLGDYTKLSADPAFKKYLEAGGKRSTLAGSLREGTPEKFVARLEKPTTVGGKIHRVVDLGLNVLELPSNLSEYLSRFSEYRRSLAMGEPDIVALYRASEVTIPFKLRGNLGGKAGQLWARSIPYLNAGMQAMYKFSRAARDNPARVATVSAGLVATSFLGAIAVMRAGTDKQKRLLANLQAGDFGTAIFFPHWNGRDLIRIRAPQEVTALTAPVYLYTISHYNKNPVRFNELLDASTQFVPDAFNVLEPEKMALNLVPQSLRPSVQTAANVKTYPNIAPIVPGYMQDREPQEQYTAYTSKVAVGLGKMLGLSPAKIEFWVRNQFGAVGGMLLGKLQSFPLARQESEIALNGRLYNEFYKQREKLAWQYKKHQAKPESYAPKEAEEIIDAHRLHEKMADALANARKAGPLSETQRQALFDALLRLNRGESGLEVDNLVADVAAVMQNAAPAPVRASPQRTRTRSSR